MWIQGAFALVLPPRGQAALAVDFVGEPVGAVVLTVVVATACLALGRRRLAVVAVVGPIATGVVTTVLKPVVGRTMNGPHLAFPSGHTAFVTAVAMVVGLLAVVQLRTGVAHGTLIVAGAVCIAGGAMTWAQVVLTAHYPTDTVGGLPTAVAVVPAVAYAVDSVPRLGSPESRSASGP